MVKLVIEIIHLFRVVEELTKIIFFVLDRFLNFNRGRFKLTKTIIVSCFLEITKVVIVNFSNVNMLKCNFLENNVTKNARIQN
jgi:hypothetical protein